MPNHRLTHPTSDENQTWPSTRTMSSRVAGSKSSGNALAMIWPITSPTSRWQRAACGSVDDSAVITASDRLGSVSIARVARRRTLITRSATVSPTSGRWATRRPRSRAHSTSDSASRWSFDAKYR